MDFFSMYGKNFIKTKKEDAKNAKKKQKKINIPGQGKNKIDMYTQLYMA